MERIYFIIILIGLLFIGCINNTEINNAEEIKQNTTTETSLKTIEKLEIIHFHGDYQCSSCITVGNYAEETVNTYFKNELESGLIEFKHINGQLKENEILVMRYGASGSSLWIGTYYKNGDFETEENIKVWYKTNNKNDYLAYLKDVIEKKLNN